MGATNYETFVVRPYAVDNGRSVLIFLNQSQLKTAIRPANNDIALICADQNRVVWQPTMASVVRTQSLVFFMHSIRGYFQITWLVLYLLQFKKHPSCKTGN